MILFLKVQYYVIQIHLGTVHMVIFDLYAFPVLIALNQMTYGKIKNVVGIGLSLAIFDSQ